MALFIIRIDPWDEDLPTSNDDQIVLWKPDIRITAEAVISADGISDPDDARPRPLPALRGRKESQQQRQQSARYNIDFVYINRMCWTSHNQQENTQTK